MISKKTLAALAALAKVPVADLETAAAATDEQDVAIAEDLTSFTKTELTTRDSNLKTTEYKKGGEAAVEKLIKDQKKALGLEFEGKEPADFFEAYNEKILADAKITPDATVKEKEAAIKKLQATVAKLEQEKTETLGQVSKVKMQGEILRAVPANLIAGMEADEVLATMERKGYAFEEKDGMIITKKNGEIVADTKLEALPLKDVINGYVTERGWLDTEEGAKEGRGEGNSKKKPHTGTPTKLSEATKAWKEAGKNEGTADFSRYVADLQTKNANFNMDE